MSRKIHQRAGSAKLTPENVKAEDLKRLRRQTRRESEGHTQDKLNAIACCYAIACALDKNTSRREMFMANPFFDDLKHKPEEDDLSQWVLLYNFRAKKKGPARDRARRYGAILRRYKEEGVPPTQALAQLDEEGGITSAYKRCAKKRRALGRDGADDESSLSLSGSEALKGESADGQHESGPEKKRKSPYPPHDERSILKVDCTEEQIYAVLALSQAKMTVQITPSPKPGNKGWQLVKLLAFEAQP